MSYEGDDRWLIILIAIVFLGAILSLSGYFLLSGLGLFGIEKQLWAFDQIRSLSYLVCDTIRWLILPVFIFIVGSIALFILYKTEWNNKKEEGKA